jgi:hypothetical protein
MNPPDTSISSELKKFFQNEALWISGLLREGPSMKRFSTASPIAQTTVENSSWPCDAIGTTLYDALRVVSHADVLVLQLQERQKSRPRWNQQGQWRTESQHH